MRGRKPCLIAAERLLEDVTKSKRAAASMEPPPKSAREADGRRGQEVDGDAYKCLNGKEQVVKALIKGHFFGGLSRFTVHPEDGQGARGPREGLNIEDEDVEGGGQEGRNHSENQHGVSFVDVSLNWTPTYCAQARINTDTTPQSSHTQRVSPHRLRP